VYVCLGFVMCGCFGDMCTCNYCVLYFVLRFLYCSICVYSYLFFSVLVLGLLPSSDNSISVNNNNNNNNNTVFSKYSATSRHKNTTFAWKVLRYTAYVQAIKHK
jgi:hypothetical protein